MIIPHMRAARGDASRPSARPAARPLKLRGSGAYLPERCVTAEQLERELRLPAGWIERKTGVRERRFADPVREGTVMMATRAIESAMRDAGCAPTDVDWLISASAVGARPLPSTASLIQRALGPAWRGLPCFDVNATCLGFLTALDLAASLLASGRGRRVVIVCSELASLGLDWTHPEAACLFGDAAVAWVLERPESGDSANAPAIVHADFATFGEGADICTVRGGALEQPARHHNGDNARDYLFAMDGHALHALASRELPPFLRTFLDAADCPLKTLDLVVPHQAGMAPMRILQRKLGISDEQFVVTVEQHGNVISASIPLALHLARAQGRLPAGRRVLLVGTAAGVTLGAALLRT